MPTAIAPNSADADDRTMKAAAKAEDALLLMAVCASQSPRRPLVEHRENRKRAFDATAFIDPQLSPPRHPSSCALIDSPPLATHAGRKARRGSHEESPSSRDTSSHSSVATVDDDGDGGSELHDGDSDMDLLSEISSASSNECSSIGLGSSASAGESESEEGLEPRQRRRIGAPIIATSIAQQLPSATPAAIPVGQVAPVHCNVLLTPATPMQPERDVSQIPATPLFAASAASQTARPASTRVVHASGFSPPISGPVQRATKAGGVATAASSLPLCIQARYSRSHACRHAVIAFSIFQSRQAQRQAQLYQAPHGSVSALQSAHTSPLLPADPLTPAMQLRQRRMQLQGAMFAPETCRQLPPSAHRQQQQQQPCPLSSQQQQQQWLAQADASSTATPTPPFTHSGLPHLATRASVVPQRRRSLPSLTIAACALPAALLPSPKPPLARMAAHVHRRGSISSAHGSTVSHPALVRSLGGSIDVVGHSPLAPSVVAAVLACSHQSAHSDAASGARSPRSLLPASSSPSGRSMQLAQLKAAQARELQLQLAPTLATSAASPMRVSELSPQFDSGVSSLTGAESVPSSVQHEGSATPAACAAPSPAGASVAPHLSRTLDRLLHLATRQHMRAGASTEYMRVAVPHLRPSCS